MNIFLKNKLKPFLLCLIIIFQTIFTAFSVSAEEKLLIPVGKTIGITLDLSGVIVTDTAVVTDYEGNITSPAKKAGIEPGDTIEKINGCPVTSAKNLEDIINKNGESPLNIKLIRNGKPKELTVKASLSCIDGFYRIGVWIKDAASGIGTITYVDDSTKEFGALGHAISENANSTPIPISRGSILDATVVSVQKGEKGTPGELIGVFTDNKEKIGKISSNEPIGIKGTLLENSDILKNLDKVPIAKRHEVYEGEAEIRSNIEGDKIEKFCVEIQKINKDESNTRGMIIKVTDNKLLDKTGGIVQGMSGSPIIQDGKLVGAVTHVFVNDPTRGYGIFIENMITETGK